MTENCIDFSKIKSYSDLCIVACILNAEFSLLQGGFVNNWITFFEAEASSAILKPIMSNNLLFMCSMLVIFFNVVSVDIYKNTKYCVIQLLK